MQEVLASVPGLGGGDLFEQLEITLAYEDTILYDGPMSGLAEPLEVTGQIGPVISGQVKVIDVTVYLPGPETGNEYQGASVQTSFSVQAQCEGGGSCTVTLSPEDVLFSLGNLNPGDRYFGKLGFIIEFMEVPSYICETAWGYGGADAIPFPLTPPSEIEILPERPGGGPPDDVEVPPKRPGSGFLPETTGESFLMGIGGLLMVLAGAMLKRKDRQQA